MKSSFWVVLAALGLAGTSGAQDTPRPNPSFSIRLSGPQREAKARSPIEVRATLTNVSDHDFRSGLVLCRECKAGRRSQMDFKVYDSEGNLVPEITHGKRINGRAEDQLDAPVSVVSFAIKPGDFLLEDADLSDEVGPLKPGKYTVQAERRDPYSGGELVKSNIITITVVQ